MSGLNNWDKIKLKEICSFINGDAYKDTDWSNNGVPIVRIQNLNDIKKPFNYWAGQIEDRVTIDNNDLLLAWSGTPGTSFGAHIWNRGFALLNQHIFKVIYNQDKANLFWLKCAINQILKIMIDKSHGAVGLRHITKPEVENLEILLPPLEEQEHIVKIIETKLTAVDKAKIASDQQKTIIIDFLSSFVQNLIYNKDWETYNFGDICLFTGGSQPPKSTFSYQPKENYIRLVQIQDFRKNDTAVYIPKETARKTFTKDNVMIGRYGPPVFQILRGLEGAYNVALMKAEPLDNYVLDNNFLFYLLQEKKLQNAVINQSQRSAGQSGVDKLFLERQIVNIPDINTQKSIVEKIEKYKQKSIALQAYINEQSSYINALPSSILKKAFNGDY
jgi:type I restriction enzyme S subunit